MQTFDTMMREFSASANRYDFEQRQEAITGNPDSAFEDRRDQLNVERRASGLAHFIATRAAADDLLTHAVQDDLDGVWLNIEHTSITDDERGILAIAVAYLDARRLLDRHPHWPHLLRLRDRCTS